VNHTQQQLVSKLHVTRNVSAALVQDITKNWRMQTGDKQTVTSPIETIHVAQMMLRSAAVRFGLSHCCTVTAGCQHAFRNGDIHSRFPRSKHIIRVTYPLPARDSTNPLSELLKFFSVQSATPHFSGHFPNK
jgi:hypothetical protein